MKLGIVIYSPDEEVLWCAFRLGTKVMQKGDTATIFLLGKAVECDVPHTEDFPVQDALREFEANGGEVYACGSCMALRSDEYSDDEVKPLFSTEKDLYSIIQESDKLLTF